MSVTCARRCRNGYGMGSELRGREVGRERERGRESAATAMAGPGSGMRSLQIRDQKWYQGF